MNTAIINYIIKQPAKIYNMKASIFFKKPNKKYLLIALLITTSFSVNAQSKPWPVPSASINKTNPSKGDPQALLTGKALYITYCTPCHGKSGRGDGAAAADLGQKSLAAQALRRGAIPRPLKRFAPMET